jgi:hypothetical protein
MSAGFTRWIARPRQATGFNEIALLDDGAFSLR